MLRFGYPPRQAHGLRMAFRVPFPILPSHLPILLISFLTFLYLSIYQRYIYEICTYKIMKILKRGSCAPATVPRTWADPARPSGCGQFFGLKNLPRRLQMALRCAKRPPRSLQMAPRCSRRPPRRLQDTPRSIFPSNMDTLNLHKPRKSFGNIFVLTLCINLA